MSCCVQAQPLCEEAAPWLEVITDQLLGQKKPAQPKELQTVKIIPLRLSWEWREVLFQPVWLFPTSAKARWQCKDVEEVDCL